MNEAISVWRTLNVAFSRFFRKARVGARVPKRLYLEHRGELRYYLRAGGMMR